MTDNAAIAKNLNATADDLTERAKFILEIVNELGDDWAEEAYGDEKVAGRHSALRSLTEYAAVLHNRSSETRARAFKELSDD